MKAIDQGEFDEESGQVFIQSKIEQIDAKIRELDKAKQILQEIGLIFSLFEKLQKIYLPY